MVGDKYVNGTIIPRSPPPQQPQQSRGPGQFNKNMTRDNKRYRPPLGGSAQQNYRGYPPQGGNQNSGPGGVPFQPHVSDFRQ